MYVSWICLFYKQPPPKASAGRMKRGMANVRRVSKVMLRFSLLGKSKYVLRDLREQAKLLGGIHNPLDAEHVSRGRHVDSVFLSHFEHIFEGAHQLLP